ncbi:MAG: AbrB/MazE/SpoVT family DNA-binding domain-containing protein [Anaerolineae bacterium]|jgi:antitoxin MazE
MRKRIGRWGNSLAVRIPKAFADEVGLDEDSPVEVSILNGQLVVAPARDTTLSLERMLEQVTPDNVHGEVITGPAVGREVW